jgi:hypothetical protein
MPDARRWGSEGTHRRHDRARSTGPAAFIPARTPRRLVRKRVAFWVSERGRPDWDDAAMNGFVRTAAVLTTALALVAGCSGDDGSGADARPVVADTTAAPETTEAPVTTEAPAEPTVTTEAPAEPTTTVEAGPRPLYRGVLQPGTYVATRFSLPLTFAIEDEWEAMERVDSLLLNRQPVEGANAASGELALLLGPADSSVDSVVERLRTNPGITFDEPEPATIAGLEGVVLRSEGSAEEVDFLWLIDDEMGTNWYVPAGRRQEVYVVDSDGTTLMIWINARPESWDEFRPGAQSLLDSIEWGE